MRKLALLILGALSVSVFVPGIADAGRRVVQRSTVVQSTGPVVSTRTRTRTFTAEAPVAASCDHSQRYSPDPINGDIIEDIAPVQATAPTAAVPQAPAASPVSADDDPLCVHCGKPLSQHATVIVQTAAPLPSETFSPGAAASTARATATVPRSDVAAPAAVQSRTRTKSRSRG